MRIVDLSMTVEECDSTPFAPDETYFKIRPIIKWEEKGFVSNVVEMTVHGASYRDDRSLRSGKSFSRHNDTRGLSNEGSSSS